MRHRSIAAVLAALASLAIASTAIAGGWAQVTAQNPPVDPPVGQETTINLEVLQHGETPVSWPDLSVIATNKATGDTVRVKAQAQGPAGSYVATITFPSAGAWTLTFDSTDLMMEGWVPLQIAAGVGAAPAGAGTQNGAPAGQAGSGTDVSMLLVLLFALAVGFAVAGLGLLGRRSSTETPASART